MCVCVATETAILPDYTLHIIYGVHRSSVYSVILCGTESPLEDYLFIIVTYYTNRMSYRWANGM